MPVINSEGTHDTMSFYGWPISQCQTPLTSNPLLHQLQSGIRILDIRLSIIDGKLISFHGLYPQRTPFTSILATLYQFLSTDEGGGKTECVVVSIKQEDTASPLFTSLIHSEIDASQGGKDLWYTESNRIPTLGEVRGKCVLFSRFGDPVRHRLGIHPDRWPDSRKEGFEWDCGGTLVRVSDWYVLGPLFRWHYWFVVPV
jgi:1-phosphatidylinositol phosphodiesterase